MSDLPTTTQPPALPPRKRSPLSLPLSTAPALELGSVVQPPPLPPRSKIVIPTDEIRDAVRVKREQVQVTEGGIPRVEVVDASPLEGDSGVGKALMERSESEDIEGHVSGIASVGGTADVEVQVEVGPFKLEPTASPRQPSPRPEPQPTISVQQQPQPSQKSPSLTHSAPTPPHSSPSEQTTTPSMEWLILTGGLVLLAYISAYFHLSFLYTILAGSLACVYAVHASPSPTGLVRESEGKEKGDKGEGNEAVGWLNHTLYALFPLISTDVLTPFIDLLEDALIQQVPPMVTSARITSPALGSQPVLLTSFKTLSDEEWFASISTAEKRPTSKHKSNPSVDSNLSPKSGLFTRTRSSTTSSRHSRTPSGGSTLDPETVASESRNRRKRDRILQTISGRRGQAPSSGARDDLSSPPVHNPSAPATGGKSHDGVGREIVGSGNDPVEDNHGEKGGSGQQGRMDGDRHIGGEGKEELDEVDPNVGQYVNYQIGFEYKRSESAKRKGWGLHMLAYFGVGLKGLGSTELPVYIDLLSLTGLVNVRLLLSASPPFVRTGTFSFANIPDFDISAKPLKNVGLGSFDAVRLPGVKPYIRSCIASVAEAFVRPESYSLDLDRLLLGREAALRTTAVGVLEIIIHGARDLPKTDAIGTCDPYVALSFAKFNKPVFSTRTIVDTQDPIWEEPAFVLVSSDAIESGEKLRIRVVDSDRFSADDEIGIIELDLADLVEDSLSLSSPKRREDPLFPNKREKNPSGTLDWSIRFCPIWQMPKEEMTRRLNAAKAERIGEPEEEEVPWWLKMIQGVGAESPDWEKERAKRRKETLAWFTGEKERDEMEAASKPAGDLRSGVLQFHIHQCNDLEVESLAGTYSSQIDSRTSAAVGKPALADVADRGATENPDPPSSYCEVYLNDKLVYRTRTKQVTPLPYFNAVSERFIRDWTKARISFVIRDERDREHDPILGMVNLRLKDALADRSQFTRWFPLVGGLGWGRIRLSLLFKPVDMHLEPGISGFEVATMEIRSLSSTGLSRGEKTSIVIETEGDKHTLAAADGSHPEQSRVSLDTTRSIKSFKTMLVPDIQNEVAWDIDRPIRLAVEYRHSCSVLFSVVSRSGVLKKKKVQALAVLRLSDVEDAELVERTIPIFNTAVVKDALAATYAYNHQQDEDPDKDHPAFKTDPNVHPIGFITLSFVLHPGVSHAHRKLCKRDLRFRKVYEAWELGDDFEREASTDGVRGRSDRLDDGESSSENDSSDEDEDEGDDSKKDIKLEESDDESGFMAERRARSKALHKKNKGVFQLKIARTGKFVKDKLEAKFIAGATNVGARDRRPRGADLEVEQEGQSRL